MANIITDEAAEKLLAAIKIPPRPAVIEEINREKNKAENAAPDTAFRQRNGVGITIRPISELITRGLLTCCVRYAPASHPTDGNTRYRPARYCFDRAGLQ
jgi:hypothetical protein